MPQDKGKEQDDKVKGKIWRRRNPKGVPQMNNNMALFKPALIIIKDFC